ncbi:MAG: PSD1 domain-containing protein [Planctomyces sp.]|nr:PSD1 domain-containing protein [Planctomyces sp.]
MQFRGVHSFLMSCVLLTYPALPSLSAQEPGSSADANQKATIQFNRDVRGILTTNCLSCHGFDAKKRQADLRLDTPEGAYTVLSSGTAAVVPGNVDASELWKRIHSTDPETVMPPPETKKTLSDAEKNVLKQWIEQGAPYQKHWAFEAPIKSEVPQVDSPSGTVASAIDAFLLSRLREEGLNPQPEADRETLIRRVSFVLTGLPPKISEVDEYLNDTSDDAYAKMVDRYLASPRYGEEQARHWLDVARYADTHGLHLDNERQMWAYRDWVIRAYNQNLPFDQFTTWQLAGDLLPEPTQDQLIATGFNRCNVTTSEGGSIEPEWVYRYAVDRTSTTVQTWLGLTGGCAVCHDHKFDPLSAKDFYSLYAFFYSAADPGMDGNIRNTNPFLKVPTNEQQQRLTQSDLQIEDARKALDEALKVAVYSDPSLSAPAAAGGEGNAQSALLKSVSDALMDDDFQYGTRVTNTSRNAVPWVYKPEFGAKSGDRVLELSSSGHFDVTVQLSLIPVTAPQNGRLEFWLRVDPKYVPRVFAIQFDDGKGNKRAVWGDEAALRNTSTHFSMGEIPPAADWQLVSVPFEKLNIAPGSQLKSMVLSQVGGRMWLDDLRVAGDIAPHEDPLSSFQAWWKTGKGGNPAGIPEPLSKLLAAGPTAEKTPEQEAELRQFYLKHVQRLSDSPVADLRSQWQTAQSSRLGLEESIPGTLIFKNLDKPREAFVMLRGQYDKPGEPVKPNVPGFLPPLRTHAAADAQNEGQPNRHDLAQWLLSEENPLTARVTVNRIWQQLFGVGLVKTSDDFGAQGHLPSHPELLDWLAVTWRESGWDMKGLIRQMLLTSAFRRSSVVTPEMLRRDPENRLYARGPRFRLDAEQLRDNALYVSGLINLEMGGRGVMPYQPPNIWEPVGYEDSNTRFYLEDSGPNLYRRSIYCFIKRTAPPPFLTNFDGTNREQSCHRRERSNTPLQALQLMNDVQHFEAARALAERTLSEGGSSDAERIEYLYRTIVSRRPTDKELTLVQDALATQRSLFLTEPDAAMKVIQAGDSSPRGIATAEETAAWTLIANLILNLDETVTRN